MSEELELIKPYKIQMLRLGKCVLGGKNSPPIKTSDCDRCRRNETAHGGHMEGTWPLRSRPFGLCKTSTPAMQTGGRQLLDDYTTSPWGTHTRRIPQSLKMCNLHSTFQTMVPRSCGQGLGHAHAMSHCEVLLDGSGGTDGYTDPANAWLLEEVRCYYFKALFEKCWARLFAFWTRVCIIT